ncbi:MAG: zf-HC2 domain-containing protein [Flavobacteriales bacterium]
MTAEPNTPMSPPSREHLLRYLRGELSPTEQHAVERHLEADPLLREAVEGLSQPGALDALDGWRPPKAPAQWPYRMLGGALALGVVFLVVWMFRMPSPDQAEVKTLLDAQQDPEHPPLPPNTDSVLRVVHEEIAAAVVPARTNARLSPTVPAERFQRIDTMITPVVRDTMTRRVQVQPAATPAADPVRNPAPLRPAHRSRQLVYLHDLKLVHPKELYGDRLPVLIPAGVPADRENARSGMGPAPVNVSYLDFMDRAMAAFVEGRSSMALDDLYFLLGQYPDDVNAQFYAGLCCYDLGLYPRARKLLDRAAHNAVDTFNEEAAWYEALATERQEGSGAADAAFARIAEAGGFYAAQARAKLPR